MRSVLIFLVLSLAACTKVVPLPDHKGKQTYFVECRGAALSWADCYQQANQMCPSGYEILSKDQGMESQAMQAKSALIANAGHDRSLTIACR